MRLHVSSKKKARVKIASPAKKGAVSSSSEGERPVDAELQPPKARSPVAQEEEDADERNCRHKQLRLSVSQNLISGIGAGISVVTLIFLIGSFRLTKRSTDAATGQAEIAKKEYLSSQRPWLFLTTETETKLNLTANQLWMTPNSTIKNVGHSIAKEVVYTVHVVTPKTEKGTECEVPKDPDLRKYYEQGGGFVIFPDQTVRTNTFPGMAVVAEATPLFLITCVRYRSEIDEEFHLTKVRYWIYRKATVGSPEELMFRPGSGTLDVSLRADENGVSAK